mgnify:CR=1 FL=1
MPNNLIKKILHLYPRQDKNMIFKSGREGYWSNLSKQENNKFEKILENDGNSKVVDLHIWSIGSSQYAAAIDVITTSASSDHSFRDKLSGFSEIAHSTLSLQRIE